MTLFRAHGVSESNDTFHFVAYFLGSYLLLTYGTYCLHMLLVSACAAGVYVLRHTRKAINCESFIGRLQSTGLAILCLSAIIPVCFLFDNPHALVALFVLGVLCIWIPTNRLGAVIGLMIRAFPPYLSLASFRKDSPSSRCIVESFVRAFMHSVVSILALSTFTFAHIGFAYFLYRHNPESKLSFKTTLFDETVYYEGVILVSCVMFSVMLKALNRVIISRPHSTNVQS